MDIMEIVLLIVGGLVLAASFLVPAGKEKDSENTKALVRDEIKNLVGEEMDKVKAHVDDVVDEAVEYALEKTERSLERLSNEKIMAVSEYSDTVLREIHKNHEEAMFLYDMLNDKHKNIKSTVSEVTKTVKKMEDSAKVTVAMPSAKTAEENMGTQKLDEPKQDDFKQIDFKGTSPQMDISFIKGSVSDSGNSNERILELRRQGKSNVAIAKELGLGVGEVKLVIDLYKDK